MGHFPASTPGTLRAAVVKGQRPVAELVDKHKIRNQGVRDLLIHYASRRSVEVDYSTLTSLVTGRIHAARRCGSGTARPWSSSRVPGCTSTSLSAGLHQLRWVRPPKHGSLIRDEVDEEGGAGRAVGA